MLLCSFPSRGDDAGDVIAGMTTEAEKCRYVLQLCNKVRFDRASLAQNSPDNTTTPDARAKYEFLRSIAAADEERLRAALRVVHGKDEKRPTCLDECKDLGA
jgi:hypothetical protein